MSKVIEQGPAPMGGFQPTGNYGVDAAVDTANGFVYLRIHADKAKARQPGIDEKTGKAKVYHMAASTGGWTSINGTDLRVSLNAGFKGL